MGYVFKLYLPLSFNCYFLRVSSLQKKWRCRGLTQKESIFGILFYLSHRNYRRTLLHLQILPNSTTTHFPQKKECVYILIMLQILFCFLFWGEAPTTSHKMGENLLNIFFALPGSIKVAMQFPQASSYDIDIKLFFVNSGHMHTFFPTVSAVGNFAVQMG